MLGIVHARSVHMQLFPEGVGSAAGFECTDAEPADIESCPDRKQEDETLSLTEP